jgi:hypothetical protein
MILYYQSQTEIGGDNPVTNTYLKPGVGLMRQLNGQPAREAEGPLASPNTQNTKLATFTGGRYELPDRASRPGDALASPGHSPSNLHGGR